VAACANLFLVLLAPPVQAAGPPDPDVGQATAESTDASQAFPMEEFLDRLMVAESGGGQFKKNPRSTALGPFQFIESTFLSVVSRHFPSELAGLSEREVLALRTDMAFSRRAAAAYARDLISALRASDLPATAANVRIAFLVGPLAAVRLLKAHPDRPLRKVLSADAIAANPYMSAATVATLVRRAAADVRATADTAPRDATRDDGPPPAAEVPQRAPAATPVVLSGPPSADAAVPEREPPARAVALERDLAHAPDITAGAPAAARSPGVPFGIRCEVGLASCRKWIALQERKAQSAVRSAQR
jgi:hypothetical protein